MKKYNFRFVDDPENPNVGLTIEETGFLQKTLNLKFPQVYVSYLQNAGKNSNVFKVETRANELIKIQNELKSELGKLNLLQNENILCIKKEERYDEYFSSNFETYYFFILSENKSYPELYVLKDICINEGWNAFQKTVEKKKENYVVFINEKTDKKYGLTIKQHLKNIPLYIISVPISIILITVFGISGLNDKLRSRTKKT